MDLSNIKTIVDKHKGNLGGMISILEDIQAKFSYLPENVLREVSRLTGTSLTDIYGVATFYKAFSLKPRGKHLISACLGTACHVRDAPQVAQAFSRELGIKSGETTPDREFTLETVACLGACALGPIVMADGHYFSKVKPFQTKKIISDIREGLDKIDMKAGENIFPVEVSCPRCNHLLMNKEHLIDGYPSIWVTISFQRNHGWMRLSSVYGSYNVECEFELEKNDIINFFCPHCHGELLGGSNCPLCSAPMVPMIVRGGGMVQICSRNGCTSHMLDLDGVNF